MSERLELSAAWLAVSQPFGLAVVSGAGSYSGPARLVEILA